MLLTWCGIWKKIRELSDGSSLLLFMKVLCGRIAADYSAFMYWIGWNDKLCADTTHRPTGATVVVGYVAIVRIEVQVQSVVKVRIVE